MGYSADFTTSVKILTNVKFVKINLTDVIMFTFEKICSTVVRTDDRKCSAKSKNKFIFQMKLKKFKFWWFYRLVGAISTKILLPKHQWSSRIYYIHWSPSIFSFFNTNFRHFSHFWDTQTGYSQPIVLISWFFQLVKARQFCPVNKKIRELSFELWTIQWSYG